MDPTSQKEDIKIPAANIQSEIGELYNSQNVILCLVIVAINIVTGIFVVFCCNRNKKWKSWPEQKTPTKTRLIAPECKYPGKFLDERSQPVKISSTTSCSKTKWRWRNFTTIDIKDSSGRKRKEKWRTITFSDRADGWVSRAKTDKKTYLLQLTATGELLTLR